MCCPCAHYKLPSLHPTLCSCAPHTPLPCALPLCPSHSPALCSAPVPITNTRAYALRFTPVSLTCPPPAHDLRSVTQHWPTGAGSVIPCQSTITYPAKMCQLQGITTAQPRKVPLATLKGAVPEFGYKVHMSGWAGSGPFEWAVPLPSPWPLHTPTPPQCGIISPPCSHSAPLSLASPYPPCWCSRSVISGLCHLQPWGRGCRLYQKCPALF